MNNTKLPRNRRFAESNYSSIFCNGATLRIPIDPKKEITELRFPEFYDVSLGTKCSGGCPECYTNALKSGVYYRDVVTKIQKFFGTMDMNERPYCVACLAGDTLVATKNGLVPIQTLKIGDYIFGISGENVKIINTTQTIKPSITIYGNKGFKVVCSEDHIFKLLDGSMCYAKDLLNKKISTVYLNNSSDAKNDRIDLADYKKPHSHKKNKGGGCGASIIHSESIQILPMLPAIPRFIALTEELMWVYGCVIAEGFKKGIALHRNELDKAKRCISLYNTLTNGLGAAIRKNGANGITVEFKKPKIWSTIFFDALQIGNGSHNKTLKFLFQNNLSTNLIKSAIIGLFENDGCFRVRSNKRDKSISYSAHYKTCNFTLAQELTFLLKSKFNIYASIIEEIIPERYIEERLLKATKAYSVNIYNAQDFFTLFGHLDRFKNDLILKGKQNTKHSKDFIEIKKIERGDNQLLFDITIDSKDHLFIINHGIITHNCGGGGEPTEHPDFIEVLKAFKELDIVPNYTTNATNLSDEIIEATKKYSDGVAISLHPHLKKYWEQGVERLIDNKIRTNVHIIISDKKSIDLFMDSYHKWNGKIDYFVALPYMVRGRAKETTIDFDYLDKRLTEIKDQSNIAFGANFYEYLKRTQAVKACLYPPEIMSKYLLLDDNLSLYNNSFDMKPVMWNTGVVLE